jgi:hypothetical protein
MSTSQPGPRILRQSEASKSGFCSSQFSARKQPESGGKLFAEEIKLPVNLIFSSKKKSQDRLDNVKFKTLRYSKNSPFKATRDQKML